jgi:hypothetical protein
MAGRAIDLHEVALSEILNPRGVKGKHWPPYVPGMFQLNAHGLRHVNGHHVAGLEQVWMRRASLRHLLGLSRASCDYLSKSVACVFAKTEASASCVAIRCGLTHFARHPRN